MPNPSDDPIERLIEKALAWGEKAQAPQGFTERVESRLMYVRLLDKQRRVVRRAVAAGAGGLVALVCVTMLFVRAINVPAWVIENVPGVLGRLDAATIGLNRFGLPIGLSIAGAVAGASAWVLFRTRAVRAKSRT